MSEYEQRSVGQVRVFALGLNPMHANAERVICCVIGPTRESVQEYWDSQKLEEKESIVTGEGYTKKTWCFSHKEGHLRWFNPEAWTHEPLIESWISPEELDAYRDLSEVHEVVI